LHDEYVKQGYEGLILRDGDAPYLWKHRGKELLKYKEFIDEEFRIIGYRAGTGVDEGTIIFKCHTGGRRDKCLPYGANGSGYFDCRPKGTVEYRSAMYDTGWRFVGKMLTVRYQERTLYDVPKFPVGISIRDYE
jgi:DNA ligase-1